LAFAEVHLGQNRGLGLAVFGGVGDVEEEVVVADLERRGVDVLGLGLAPVPDGVEDGEAVAAEAFGAADAPGVFVVAGKAVEAGLDLALALLVEPA